MYLLLPALAGGLAGCTTARTPLNGAPPSTAQNLTGNWVFQTTATSSANPFTQLAGYIDEVSQSTDDTTAAFQAQPTNSTCYLGAETVPFEGTVTTTTPATPVGATTAPSPTSTLGLHSFQVNGQAITINATTTNAAATTLSGTYSVAGGCANGAAGTLIGTRYATINGTYAGNVGSDGFNINLVQNTDGTGSGNFSFSSGTASFTGISCFTTGTLADATNSSTIIGNAVTLTFDTDSTTSAQVILNGTINQTASTLTLTSATISNGPCAGSLGGATLTMQ